MTEHPRFDDAREAVITLSTVGSRGVTIDVEPSALVAGGAT